MDEAKRILKAGRSPHGERGLKFRQARRTARRSPSLSSRRAWIEITGLPENMEAHMCRSPHGERGLKYRPRRPTVLHRPHHDHRRDALSLSSRRAWIEISRLFALSMTCWSLSSRRAWIEIIAFIPADRIDESRSPHGERGLKLAPLAVCQQTIRSLSSRRAWIEISLAPLPST